MTEYKAVGDGIEFYFTFDDEDNPTLVSAWVEELPGANLDERTRSAEAAIERASGKRLNLRCRFAKGSDYRFEVL